MNLRFAPLFASLALSLGAAACSFAPSEEPTTGAEGRARFAYATDCFLDCSVTRPMLVGTREVVSVRAVAGSLPKLDVKTTDPSILTVAARHTWSCCHATESSAGCGVVEEHATCAEGSTKRYDLAFEVVAHAAGTAEIGLVDAAGATFDRVTLEAAIPARFDLQRTRDAHSIDRIELLKGNAIQLRLDAYDAKGRILQAAAGIHLTVVDPEIARFDDPSLILKDPEGFASLHDEPMTQLVLRGRAAGSTKLAITSPGFGWEVPVTVLE